MGSPGASGKSSPAGSSGPGPPPASELAVMLQRFGLTLAQHSRRRKSLSRAAAEARRVCTPLRLIRPGTAGAWGTRARRGRANRDDAVGPGSACVKLHLRRSASAHCLHTDSGPSSAPTSEARPARPPACTPPWQPASQHTEVREDAPRAGEGEQAAVGARCTPLGTLSSLGACPRPAARGPSASCPPGPPPALSRRPIGERTLAITRPQMRPQTRPGLLCRPCSAMRFTRSQDRSAWPPSRALQKALGPAGPRVPRQPARTHWAAAAWLPRERARPAGPAKRKLTPPLTLRQRSTAPKCAQRREHAACTPFRSLPPRWHRPRRLPPKGWPAERLRGALLRARGLQQPNSLQLANQPARQPQRVSPHARRCRQERQPRPSSPAGWRQRARRLRSHHKRRQRRPPPGGLAALLVR